MSALRGTPVDVARFLVALAPNRPDLRRQLEQAIETRPAPAPQQLDLIPRSNP